MTSQEETPPVGSGLRNEEKENDELSRVAASLIDEDDTVFDADVETKEQQAIAKKLADMEKIAEMKEQNRKRWFEENDMYKAMKAQYYADKGQVIDLLVCIVATLALTVIPPPFSYCVAFPVAIGYFVWRTITSLKHKLLDWALLKVGISHDQIMSPVTALKDLTLTHLEQICKALAGLLAMIAAWKMIKLVGKVKRDRAAKLIKHTTEPKMSVMLRLASEMSSMTLDVATIMVGLGGAVQLLTVGSFYFPGIHYLRYIQYLKVSDLVTGAVTADKERKGLIVRIAISVMVIMLLIKLYTDQEEAPVHTKPVVKATEPIVTIRASLPEKHSSPPPSYEESVAASQQHSALHMPRGNRRQKRAHFMYYDAKAYEADVDVIIGRSFTDQKFRAKYRDIIDNLEEFASMDAYIVSADGDIIDIESSVDFVADEDYEDSNPIIEAAERRVRSHAKESKPRTVEDALKEEFYKTVKVSAKKTPADYPVLKKNTWVPYTQEWMEKRFEERSEKAKKPKPAPKPKPPKPAQPAQNHARVPMASDFVGKIMQGEEQVGTNFYTTYNNFGVVGTAAHVLSQFQLDDYITFNFAAMKVSWLKRDVIANGIKHNDAFCFTVPNNFVPVKKETQKVKMSLAAPKLGQQTVTINAVSGTTGVVVSQDTGGQFNYEQEPNTLNTFGDSGSPVLGDNHKIIGIHVAGASNVMKMEPLFGFPFAQLKAPVFQNAPGGISA